MKDADKPEATDEPAHNPTAHAADDARDASQDPVATRAMLLERSRKLGRRLGIEIEIDRAGWLRSEIEVVIDKDRDGALRPVKVRIGRDTRDDALLANGGVLASCAAYNEALAKLRQLAERLTDLVRQGRVRLEPGSPIEYAHAQLCRLDELISRRQRSTMGHGVVHLAILWREAEFYRRCDAHLAPIVQAAEDAMNGRTRPATSRARKRWPWASWWRARRAATQHPHDAPPVPPRSPI